MLEINDSRNDNLTNTLDLKHAKENIIESQDFWLKHLALKNTDKECILSNGKLNSQIIEAVNIIARKQLPSISGLQLTEGVPKYISNERRWHLEPSTAMKNIPNDKSLACQIHHTGRDHWVVSFRDVTDSLSCSTVLVLIALHEI